MKKVTNILLYGFSKYDIIEDNPSEQLVKTLEKLQIDRVKIDTLILEVSYKNLQKNLIEKLNQISYDIILGFGAAPGSIALRLERVAFNLIDTPSPDIDGRQIQNKKIKEKGAEAISTNLDLYKIRNILF